MDTGLQLLPRRRSGRVRPRRLELRGRAREPARARRAPRRGGLLGRRPRVLRAAAGREGDRRLLLRLRRQVPPRLDGGARRRAVARAARRRLRARRARLPGRHRPGAPDRRRARSTSSRGRSRRRGSTSASRAARTRRVYASSSVPAVRARRRRRGDRREPVRRDRALVRARAASCSSSHDADEAVAAYRDLLDDPAQAEELGRRARERVLDEHTYRHRARRLLELRRPRGRRRMSTERRSSTPSTAVAPLAAVKRDRDRARLQRGAERRPRARRAARASTRASTSSSSPTARPTAPPRWRRRAARTCVRLPFNLGIGGAVQTGFRYAWEEGYELAVRLDGDGQHDPAAARRVVAPVVAGEADIAVGSRFLGAAATARRRRAGSASASSRASSR